MVTDPLSQNTTYRFTPTQLLTDVTDPSGQTKTFNLDPTSTTIWFRRLFGTAVCSACGDSSYGNQSFTLDSNGNTLSITDALGNTTTYTYEPLFNKVTSIADPLGNVTRFAYDSHGNLTTCTDPNGNKDEGRPRIPWGRSLRLPILVNQNSTLSDDGLGNVTIWLLMRSGTPPPVFTTPFPG